MCSVNRSCHYLRYFIFYLFIFLVGYFIFIHIWITYIRIICKNCNSRLFFFFLYYLGQCSSKNGDSKHQNHRSCLLRCWFLCLFLDLLNWWEGGLGILGVGLNLIKSFASHSYSHFSPLLSHSIIEF